MAFSATEIFRIKRELGYNLLSTGACLYVDIAAFFDDGGVLQSNVEAEVATTTSTSVTAASSPTPTTLTLASATGITAGDRVYVDVDTLSEVATVRNVSGSDVSVALTKAHSGTYPVALEGPIPIARNLLQKCEETRTELISTYGHGALKKVDEVEFYRTGGSHFGNLGEQLMHWRNELSSVLGAPNLWDQRESAGSAMAVY